MIRTKPSTNGHSNGHAPRNRIVAALIAAVGYIRMSSDKQEASPQQQRDAITKLAAKYGYRIIRWYTDEGVSGWKSKDKRPSFQAMIEDAQHKGDFRAILCWDQDRFSRFEPMEFNYYCHILRTADVKIVSVAQGVLDFETLGGWLTASVNQHAKAQYSRDLSRNVTRGLIARAATGHWLGRPPYAYDRLFTSPDGRQVIRSRSGDGQHAPHGWAVRLVPADDEDAVAAVQQAFELYDATGGSLRSVLLELNAQREKGRGYYWGIGPLTYALKNNAYAGDTVYGKKFWGRFHNISSGREIENAEGERDKPDATFVFQNTHEPLVSRELFDRVQAKLKEREWKHEKPRTSPFTLTGILHCGLYGGRMHGRHQPNGKGKSYRYYVCKTRILGRCTSEWAPAEAVEDRMIEVLQERILDEGRLADIAAEIAKQAGATKATKGSAAGLRQQLAKLDKQIDRGVENLMLADAGNVPAASRLLKEWRNKRERLAVELADAEHTQPHDAAGRIKAALALATQLRERMKDGTPTSVRETLHRAFQGITLHFAKKGKRKSYVSRAVIDCAGVYLMDYSPNDSANYINPRIVESMGNAPAPSFQSQQPQRVAVNHRFDLPRVQPRQRRSLQQGVQRSQSFQRSIHRGEGVIRAEQQLVPDAVLLHQHQAVQQLPGPIVQGAYVREHARMLADDCHAFAFVGMAEMRQHDRRLGKPHGHRIDAAGKRAFQRRLGDEGGAGVQQDGQGVPLGIAPQRVEPLVVRVEAGIHRQQLDAAQAQGGVPVPQLVLPAGLGGIDGQETDQRVGVPGDVVGDELVVYPQPATAGLAAEDDGADRDGRCRAIFLVADGEVDFLAGAGTDGLAAEVVAEMVRVGPGMAVDIDDHVVGVKPRWTKVGREEGPCRPAHPSFWGGRGVECKGSVTFG